MNYMPELNAFAERMRRNPLSNNAQLLWYKLMDAANRLHWPETFQLDNGRLKSLLNVGSTHTVLSARQELVDDGLLEFIAGAKGKPSVYKMLSVAALEEPAEQPKEESRLVPLGCQGRHHNLLRLYRGPGTRTPADRAHALGRVLPTAAAEPERRPPSVPPHPSTGKARGWQLDNELPTGKKADFGSCLRHSP